MKWLQHIKCSTSYVWLVAYYWVEAFITMGQVKYALVALMGLMCSNDFYRDSTKSLQLLVTHTAGTVYK